MPHLSIVYRGAKIDGNSHKSNEKPQKGVGETRVLEGLAQREQESATSRERERELKCARLGVGVGFSVNVLLGITRPKEVKQQKIAINSRKGE